jgi:hypothetical protein
MIHLLNPVDFELQAGLILNSKPGLHQEGKSKALLVQQRLISELTYLMGSGLLHQDHFPGGGVAAGLHFIEIDAGGDSLSLGIIAVPG